MALGVKTPKRLAVLRVSARPAPGAGPARRPVPAAPHAIPAALRTRLRSSAGPPARGRRRLSAAADDRVSSPARFANPGRNAGQSKFGGLAPLAQSAERLHGKEKVYGSIP
jgi:hypothetical protein